MGRSRSPESAKADDTEQESPQRRSGKQQDIDDLEEPSSPLKPALVGSQYPIGVPSPLSKSALVASQINQFL
jgi:hypothetical protein